MRKYLIELRKKQNESQHDVAKSIGISRQYYAMIENGARQKKMDIVLVTALASHFNVPIDAIFSAEQDYDTTSSVP